MSKETIPNWTKEQEETIRILVKEEWKHEIICYLWGVFRYGGFASCLIFAPDKTGAWILFLLMCLFLKWTTPLNKYLELIEKK